MKKLGCWLLTIATILCCCLYCSCGKKEPAKNENLEEYYEIEYQDGSGVHVVKATRLRNIENITILETYLEGNVQYSKEWKYNYLVGLHYSSSIDESIGTFYSHISKDSTDKHFGAIWLYYNEEIEDRLAENCDTMGSLIFAKNIPINNLSLENENIIISNQKLTSFSFVPDLQSHYYGHTEYYVYGYAGNNRIYSKSIKIQIDFEYCNDKQENITLLNEGDFTTIKRRNLPDITIRTENILRKIKVENE